MVRILVVEDDAKLNRTVCTSLNDSGFSAGKRGFFPVEK